MRYYVGLMRVHFCWSWLLVTTWNITCCSVDVAFVVSRVSQKVDLSESFVHLGAESSTSFSNPESPREESCQSLIFRPTFIALLTFRAAHYTLISKHKIVPIFFVCFLHESRESEVIMAQVSKKYRLIFWDSRYFRRGRTYFKRAWGVNIHTFILLQHSSSTLMVLPGKVSAQVLLLAGQNRAICMCLTCKNWLTDSPEPQLQSPFVGSKIQIYPCNQSRLEN